MSGKMSVYVLERERDRGTDRKIPWRITRVSG